MNNKPIGIVEIMGGLGNQLFQVSFANYLKNQGMTVYISDDWFKEYNSKNMTTKRELVINPKDFEIPLVPISIKRKVKFLNELHKKKIINKSIYNFHNDTNFSISNISRFNIFYGYWHKNIYVKNQRSYLLESLLKNKNFSQYFSEDSKRTMFHIRRTDYSNEGEILPDTYYLNAIKELQKLNEKIDYDIFTDDVNYDKENIIFKNSNNIYCNLDEDPLTTLSKMMSYKNYVIANSSFSYFPAFLNENSSYIGFPDPWFKNSFYDPPVFKTWEPIKF